jgi:Family of unknown function (DUF6812)
MEYASQSTHPEEPRRERVALETATHLFKGTITLPADGYRARFSDHLNRSDLAFIALTDVEKAPLSGGPSTRYPFLSVARAAVVAGYPLDGDGN